MTRIVAFESLTLDGVMQAPGTSGRGSQGRLRARRLGHTVLGSGDRQAAQESMGNSGGLLLGRRTYEDFYGFWPKQTDNPFTEVLDNSLKYVASTSLKEPLPWKNSKLLDGDAAEAVAEIRRRPGKDLVILGSGELAHALMGDNLIDEYILLIHPLVLGSGRRLFKEGGGLAKLRLVDSKTTTTGVVIATYRPADPSKAKR